jgi:hypothetical protein
MEPPTKKQNSGDDVRFSDLPDEVVHHILDFIFSLFVLLSGEKLDAFKRVSIKMGYWQSQNFVFNHQLKEVVVQLFDRENQIELIKYLFTNAQELELMLILYTSPVSSDVITELRKFKKPSTNLSLRLIIR